MKRFLVTVLASLAVMSSTVWAGDWEDGYAAYQRRDFATAVQKWRILADQGDSAGQSILGAMYAFGQGVPQDYVESIRWYRLAAAQGDVKAQYKLGFMYANAQGVKRDMTRAYMWSYLAAAAGNTQAKTVRDEAAAQLSLEQYADAQKMARYCQQHSFKGCQ